jgi:hypothetical protein
MADLGHDAVFVEEAAALRPRLERCARALYPGIQGESRRGESRQGESRQGESRQADRAVDEALARTYGLAPDADRTSAAFRVLLHPTWRSGRNARSRQRVELLDAAPIPTGDLGEDMASLGPTSQAVVILLLLGELAEDDVGRVLGARPARIAELFADAVERLARRDPARRNPVELTRQLGRLAGASDPVASARAGVGDLGRGRRLELQGRRRRGAVVTAAAAIVALVAGFAIRAGAPAEIASVQPPTPTPTVTPSYVSDPWQSNRCDTADQACRSQVLMRWRSRISGVVVDQLDADHRYFSSMSWQVRPTDESESFWHGDGGALALGLSRFTDGGTEVYLQIATDMEYADRCGRRTKQRCSVIETMDGNLYRVAGSSTGDGGVEVQYVPDGDRVITVVARNTSAGKKLDIGSGDLIKLVRDSRLTLPRR